MLKHIATSTEHHIGHSLIHFAWNLSQTMIKGHESGKTTKRCCALYLSIHSLRRHLISISQKKKTLMNSGYTSTKDYLHQFNTSEVKCLIDHKAECNALGF